MNRKERRAAQKKGGPAVTPMAATLAQAFRAHQAGHRSDAERIYRDVLAVEPRNAAALHLLGALMHQSGRGEEAVSLIRQAVAIEPQNPDYQYNLGVILLRGNRTDDAIAHLKQAVELKSNYAEAHFELGTAYAKRGRWPDAAGHFRRVLALKPGDPSAQNNLALVLSEQGSVEEAATLWERVVQASPSFPLAHMNLGLAYKKMGRLDEAEASLRRALDEQPNLAEAQYNLASVLVERDVSEKAIDLLRKALERDDSVDTRRLLIRCLTTGSQIPLDPELEPLLFRALSEDWANPRLLYALCRTYLEIQPEVAAALKRAELPQPDPRPLRELLGPETSDHVGKNRLLLELISATPIFDTNLERLIIRLRFSLLDAVRHLGKTESLPESVFALCCAIARQCFINEYVFNEAPEEQSVIELLSGRVESALRSGAAVAPDLIAIIAAYRPLRAVPLAERLADGSVPAPLAAVLRQQLEEPGTEQALRNQIAALTPIGDGVSAAVRQHYEENPYPRWERTSRLNAPVAIDRFLSQAFPYAPFKPLGKTDDLEILIAGCGTGLEAITTAQTISAGRILAVDLSVASLATAERHTRALDLRTIDYGQADIANLPALGRSFDLIEAVGVLHHLGDPWEGWTTLLSLLRPGGVMRIGLYSALARRYVVEAQTFVRSGNYQPDYEGIRACRRNLLRNPEGSPLRKVIDFSDFYTTSQCRNLLFNVQERHFTIPEIASFLKENRLAFLGFDLPARSLRQYSRAFSHDGAITDLASWHDFETRNPDTFAGLYDFWIQKA